MACLWRRFSALRILLGLVLKMSCTSVVHKMHAQYIDLFSYWNCQLLLQVITEKLTVWNTDNAFTLELSPDINRSTVFGLLLGYPVVYWYNNATSADNCLSHVPLRLFQISAVDSTVDSQPAVIYSFTIPEQLYSNCQFFIDNWQKQLFTLASKPSIDWVYSLHADCKITVQSVVCMWCWHFKTSY